MTNFKSRSESTKKFYSSIVICFSVFSFLIGWAIWLQPISILPFRISILYLRISTIRWQCVYCLLSYKSVSSPHNWFRIVWMNSLWLFAYDAVIQYRICYAKSFSKTIADRFNPNDFCKCCIAIKLFIIYYYSFLFWIWDSSFVLRIR